MTAQEMFEKLGYERIINDKKRIVYDNNVELNEDIYTQRIVFLLDLKEIKFSVNEFNLKELQAINKQCKEMGWLDET